MGFLFLLLKNRFINLRSMAREWCPYSLFFQQHMHLDALEIEVILPSKFLNLDCVDHLLERILKTQHEQKHNG